MSLNTVTLTWDFTDLLQVKQSATLTIRPTSTVSNPNGSTVIALITDEVEFFGSGSLAGIIANDNTGLNPSNAGYGIEVISAAGNVLYNETVQILYANGATQDLSTLAAATTSGLTSSVTSFNGRTGVVTPQSGDYAAAQVGADASGAAATAQANAETYAAAQATSAASTAQSNAEAYAVANCAPTAQFQSGAIGADVTLSSTAATTILTTASLAPGTWKVDVGITCQNSNTNTSTAYEAEVSGGTATYTATGVTSAAGANPSLATVTYQTAHLHLSFLAVVTVAGNITVSARASTSTTPLAKATSPINGYPNATGYTAAKMA